MNEPRLILASSSAARRAMLIQAGVTVEVAPASVDEAAIKRAIHAKGRNADACALNLAEFKAQYISAGNPGALVIGADQVLECDNVWFDKPANIEVARRHLRSLRGKTHRLISAVVVVRDGVVLWRATDPATLAMRAFSDAFLDHYLAAARPDIVNSVGAYHLEGIGAQLFERVEGDYFTILGLPLLPLLGFLRQYGALAE